MGLPWKAHHGPIYGIGGIQATDLKGRVEVLFSPLKGEPRIVARAVILDDILGRHPQITIPETAIRMTAGLPPADRKWFVPGTIDLLLGADVLGLILSDVLPGLRIGVVENLPPYNLNTLLNKYSSFDKLIGVTAWIRRFIHNGRNPQIKIQTTTLSSFERQQALAFWVRVVQIEHFADIIDTLKRGL
ncbi:hypothetical protein Cfor_11380, partial [Coptotermes formosanus]